MPPLLIPPDVQSLDGAVRLSDFYYIAELDQFLFRATGALWTAKAINGRLPAVKMNIKRNGKEVYLKPANWLMLNRAVEQMTWMPGLAEIIEDKLLAAGGWKVRPGAHALNLYQPPQIVPGDAAEATPWVEHLKLLYPKEAEEILDWFAHRVQHPGQKINHALVMGGGHGIGKDWLLKGLSLAVGPDNFHTVRPDELIDKNNASFVRAVVLDVNETYDLGEGIRVNRFALYERIKLYAAAPPDVLPCVDKWVRRHYVANVLGLILVTNHKTDGVHLESDDRRHLVAWSDAKKEDFTDKSWTEKYNWLDGEGAGHVAAYLMQRNLSAFNPGAIPRQTPAFFEIVHASSSPEDAALADALDELGRPDALTLGMLLATPRAATMPWLEGNPRALPHRLERSGYVAVRNPNAKDGMWKLSNRRQMIYGKTTATPEDRQQAAWQLMQTAKQQERAL